MKTGSLKKIAELDKVVHVCDKQGVNYTPGNEVLTPTALASLLVVAQEKMKAVTDARAVAAMAIQARRSSFRGIPNLAARLVRLVSSSRASPLEKHQAREIKRRYFNYGKKGKPGGPVVEGTTLPGKSNGVSYGDFDSRIAGLEEIIRLIATMKEYKATETEYSVSGLQSTLENLRAIHAAAIQAEINLANARSERDKIITDVNGVDDTVTAVKEYLRGKFGFSNATLRQMR